MACQQDEEKCFTFLWKLENISYCLQKKGVELESPSFVVDEIEGTKWKLGLFPRGEKDGKYIGYYLNRTSDSNGGDKIEIKYELAFIAQDGSVLSSLTKKKRAFSKAQGYGFFQFQEREELFTLRRSAFLPKDILTARCRMWKSIGEMKDDVQYTGCTRIGVAKISFQWNVKNFSTLEPEKKFTYQMKSTENDSPLMSIDLSLTGGLSSEETVHFDLTLQDQNMKFCTLKLFLIDSSGNRIEGNHDEFWFDGNVKCKEFAFGFTKKKLLAKKSLYLPDDTLTLLWEWAFSRGVVLEETEKAQYGSSSAENKLFDVKQIKNEEKAPLVQTFTDTLKSLYDQKFLCDVNLKTTTKEFPAHKIILCASSPVFNAMFSNDMKERISDCVNIDDLSDDTVRRMLLYIYSSRMEDITWESASNVYVAADKYAILGLKNICSYYLKENLSSSNACKVLLLSDFHADDDLKETVQDYILKHDKEIINSDEWKLLMKTNGQLAAETLCLRYK